MTQSVARGSGGGIVAIAPDQNSEAFWLLFRVACGFLPDCVRKMHLLK